MKVLRIKALIDLTGMPRSTIYKYIAEGKFPKPIPLGIRNVGWLDEEIFAWLQRQIAKRDLQYLTASE